jgi:hypothetical protein
MTTSQEIEAALHRLPAAERWELLHRFSEELWIDWDRQIEADAASGRLDDILAEARREIAEGKTRSLDSVLNNR